MNQEIDKMLQAINASPDYKPMLAQFPLRQFISMQQYWPQLTRKVRQQLFIWLHRQPLQTYPLEIQWDTSFVLDLGTLHYLASGPFLVGYVLEVPRNCQIELTPTYLACLRGKPAGALDSAEEVPELEHLMNGEHLSIFAQGNSLLIAAIDKDIANFLR